MSKPEEISSHKCFGGYQKVFKHPSRSTATEMGFSLYLPPEAEKSRHLPVLYWLSGLTCTWENFTAKAGAQRYAAKHGIILVAPDTSPRGLDLPGEHEDYDFGSGAGFYVDATQTPWSQHYRMYSYIADELPKLIAQHFPVDPERQGIFGHSMGGHGALICAYHNPELFKSVSAFAPIVNPADVPWGQKAFSRYLGDNQEEWEKYDACRLIQKRKFTHSILIDQGTADQFLGEQLQPEHFEKACEKTQSHLTLRLQGDYDHSYYFISSLIGEHINWHAEALT